MRIKMVNCFQCGNKVLEITKKIKVDKKKGERKDYKCKSCGIISTFYVWYKD